ncbi:hypothetical protein [Pseudodesulfovibrio sediminis]|uniref:Uncharacterized protein n=1 Tax=Pseudodesulfovibrio sediminis TaxID=2810563 RepID=A0ABM7P3U5_9BACT|nr:hypothetical protein [Pseudodesulfovibrio sediminis]BCS87532.1 hypothetical protein PSDVSF_07740 [Pseudodesulfovibrio sediminis]
MSRKKLIWNVAIAKTGNSARWDFLRFNRPFLKEVGFHAAPLLKMTHPDKDYLG